MCGTFVFYGYISFVLCWATKSNKESKLQSQVIKINPFISWYIEFQSSQILYQSVAICFINQVSSSVYVVMNFIPVPEWLIILAQFLWQLAHGRLSRIPGMLGYFIGCPVIIYMTMNQTIRARFIRKVTFKKVLSPSHYPQ